MEFEAASINRMRGILYNLSSQIDNSLKNSKYRANLRSDDEVSFSSKGLVEHLLLFNELVDTRMKTTPVEKLKRDNYVRDSIANLQDARAEIEVLKSALEEERWKHDRYVRAISAEISEEDMLLQEMKTRHVKEIAGRKNEMEQEIASIQDRTSSEIKILEDEINSSEARLDGTLKGNLSRERELYAKRWKVEKLYLEVLEKYDRDVGALHRTKENLTRELNSLDDRLEDLRERLVIQNVRYVELKNEREMAILKAFTEDLEHFEKNRAARIIQRAWRIFYERCCMKRKKKTKKKK